MSKIIFLINANSGVSSKFHLPALIEKSAAKHQKEFEIIFTKSGDEAIEKTKSAVAQNAFAVVAVGGDGTANMIAQNLIHSGTALGIIPVGSGNGLARHLGISLKPKLAIENMFSGKIISIDTADVNGHLVLSNFGVGFLADVVHSFHRSRLRGYVAYALHTFKKYFDSQNVKLKISVATGSPSGDHVADKVGDKLFDDEFFFVSVCNANQFGYEIKLAPDASLIDGLLEFYFVKKISALAKISLLIKVLRGKSYGFSKSELIKAESAEVNFSGKLKAQIDGDPIHISSPAKIQIQKLSLRVIVP